MSINVFSQGTGQLVFSMPELGVSPLVADPKVTAVLDYLGALHERFGTRYTWQRYTELTGEPRVWFCVREAI